MSNNITDISHNGYREVDVDNNNGGGVVHSKKGSRICIIACLVTGAVVVVAAIIVSMVLLFNMNSRNSTTKFSDIHCNHPVYCQGAILTAAMKANIFSDSKTFVDMPIKGVNNAQKLVDIYEKESNQSHFVAKDFFDKYFYPAGWEVKNYSPSDFLVLPPKIKEIDDKTLYDFLFEVHQKWKSLVRKNNVSELCPDCYSSIDLPYSFVVAGGRFREFYYWDSYWIMEGLIISNMTETAKHILLNMKYIAEKYGFIPNGARIYYLNRGQPPLFTQMVYIYYKATGDKATVIELLPALRDEHDFWMNTGHRVKHQDFGKNTLQHKEAEKDGCKFVLNRFFTTNTKPRPESFKEDLETADYAVKVLQRKSADVFADIATAAETGWDFSTRWLDNFRNKNNTFVAPTDCKKLSCNETKNCTNDGQTLPPATNKIDLGTIYSRNIIPSDLNSILLRNEEILKSWYNCGPDSLLCDKDKANYFSQMADSRRYSILKYLRANSHDMKPIIISPLSNLISGVFSDLNMATGVHLVSQQKLNDPKKLALWYASAIVPMTVESIVNELTDLDIRQAYDDLEGVSCIGGVPSSNATGFNATQDHIYDGNWGLQQWDYPNGWAPIQSFSITAMEMAETVLKKRGTVPDLISNVKKLRNYIIRTWMQNNLCGFLKKQGPEKVNTLVEKYVVNQDNGFSGHGGEYSVQLGFGWSNGVVLHYGYHERNWLRLDRSECSL